MAKRKSRSTNPEKRSPEEQRRLDDLRVAILRTWRPPEYFDDLHSRDRIDLRVHDPGPGQMAESDSALGGFFPGRDDSVKWHLREARNPSPQGSFGFVGSFATLELRSTSWGTLALRFESKRLGPVARETLHLFRWDDHLGCYQILPVSAVGQPPHDYVWGLVSSSGVYGVIGINANPLVVRTLATLEAFSGLAARLPESERTRLYRDACGIALCPPIDFGGPGKNAETGWFDALTQEQQALGWPVPPSGWSPPSPEGLCEICLGLARLDWKQIPEKQILKDLSLTAVCIGAPGECVSKPLSWKSMGPTNTGAYTLDLALAPSGNIIYAATLNGGLWKMSWKGVPGQSTAFEWQPMTDALDLLQLRVNAVATSPSAPARLFIVDGHTNLLRSDDRARSWSATGSPTVGTEHPTFPNPRLTDVHRMAVDPVQPSRVLIASSRGLFEVVGQIRTTLNAGIATDVLFDPTDTTRIYAAVLGVGVLIRNIMTGGWDTLLSVADAGQLIGADVSGAVFELAIGRQGSPSTRRLAVRFSQRFDSTAGVNVVDVLKNSLSGQGGWTHCQTIGVGAQGLRVGGIAIDPADDDTMLVGAEALFRTTDGGVSWQGVAGFVHGDQHRILFDPSQPGLAYTSTDGGVFASFDHGTNWRDLNQGYVGGQIFNVGLSGPQIAGTFDDWGIKATPDIAQTDWQWIDGGAFEATPVLGDAAGRPVFYYLVSGKIVRRNFNGPPPDYADYALFQPQFGFAVDRISNSNVVLASENRGAMAGQVHRTTNGDLPNPNWQVEAGINLAPGDQIVAVAMRSRGAQRVAYALSVNGEIFQNQDVGPGRTGAQPWQRVSGRPVVFSAGNGRGLAIDPFDPDLLVIWTANDAAFSRTGGRFWRSITGSGARTLPAGGIVSIVLDYGSPNFYAGLAVGGVWQSHDEGSSWYPLGQDLPNGILSSLKYHDSTLIATIFGRGLWRLSI